jgi:hypothetical protein
MQLDSPFLISKTSGEIASHFNKIARLDEIDISTQNLNGWIKKLNSNIGHQEVQVKQFTEGLAKYDYLDKVEMGLEVLELQSSALRSLKSKRERLWDLMWEIKDVKSNIDVESGILVNEELINKLIDSIAIKKEYQDDRKKLVNLQDSILEVKEEIKQQAHILTFEKTINNLIELYQQRKEKVQQRGYLLTIRHHILDTKKKISLATVQYNVLHKEFDSVFPDICPLCNK